MEVSAIGSPIAYLCFKCTVYFQVFSKSALHSPLTFLYGTQSLKLNRRAQASKVIRDRVYANNYHHQSLYNLSMHTGSEKDYESLLLCRHVRLELEAT